MSGIEDELRQTAAELDAFSWTALLCAFEKGERWQESLDVLQDRSFLSHVCEHAGCWARSLFEDMPSQDVQPTVWQAQTTQRHCVFLLLARL